MRILIRTGVSDSHMCDEPWPLPHLKRPCVWEARAMLRLRANRLPHDAHVPRQGKPENGLYGRGVAAGKRA